MKKKVYRSKSLNRLCLLERLLWLIPLGFAVRGLFSWTSNGIIKEAMSAGNSFQVIIGMIIMLAFLVILQTVIPFWVLKAIIHSRKKQVIKNSTFKSMEDIDYYRDKLNGLSPGIISLLADLQIEQKKDVAASILKYKEMGILQKDEEQYKAGDYKNANLRESDKYLIEGLVNNTFNMQSDKQWKDMVLQESVEEGYIINRLNPKMVKSEQRKFCLGCAGSCLTQIIMAAVIAILVTSSWLNEKIEFLNKVFSEAPKNASFAEGISYLQQYPESYPAIAAMLVVVLMIFTILLPPVLAIVSFIARLGKISMLSRSEAGNEMAECIYGMKNFIHDFSNLSEADQQQVALWDDYLVYAVVLEENQQIVDEIMRRREAI